MPIRPWSIVLLMDKPTLLSRSKISDNCRSRQTISGSFGPRHCRNSLPRNMRVSSRCSQSLIRTYKCVFVTCIDSLVWRKALLCSKFQVLLSQSNFTRGGLLRHICFCPQRHLCRFYRVFAHARRFHVGARPSLRRRLIARWTCPSFRRCKIYICMEFLSNTCKVNCR